MKNYKFLLKIKNPLLMLLISSFLISSCTTSRIKYKSEIRVKDDSGKVIDEGKYSYENTVKVGRLLSASCWLTFWALGGTCWGYISFEKQATNQIKNKAEAVLDLKYGKNNWEAHSVSFYDVIGSQRQDEYLIFDTKESKKIEQKKIRENLIETCYKGKTKDCFEAARMSKEEGNIPQALKLLDRTCFEHVPQTWDTSSIAQNVVENCFEASSLMRTFGVDDSKRKAAIKNACSWAKNHNLSYKKYDWSDHQRRVEISDPCFVLENWNKQLVSCVCNIRLRSGRYGGYLLEIISSVNESPEKIKKDATSTFNKICEDQRWDRRGAKNCFGNWCETCDRLGKISERF